jgi:hypothetical protein
MNLCLLFCYVKKYLWIKPILFIATYLAKTLNTLYLRKKIQRVKNIHARNDEKLDGLAVSALRLAIAEVKQRWSLIGGVTKNLLSGALPCFGRHVKRLVPAAFASLALNNQHWGRVVGIVPFCLCVIHKDDLCPSSGNINMLMMMMTNKCIT